MMAKSNEKNKKSNANDSPGKVESTSGNSNGKSSYHQLELKLREQSEEIKKLFSQELHRIVYEFDSKNYARNFGTTPCVVMCALFGASNAQRSIIKYGLNRKK